MPFDQQSKGVTSAPLATSGMGTEQIMKKLMTVLYGLSLAATLQFAQAADSTDAGSADAKKPARRERPKLTEEQKQLRKDILAKYDANKDGKLDRDERAKISDEDKDKVKKAGLGGGPRRGGKPAGDKPGTKPESSNDSK